MAEMTRRELLKKTAVVVASATLGGKLQIPLSPTQIEPVLAQETHSHEILDYTEKEHLGNIPGFSVQDATFASDGRVGISSRDENNFYLTLGKIEETESGRIWNQTSQENFPQIDRAGGLLRMTAGKDATYVTIVDQSTVTLRTYDADLQGHTDIDLGDWITGNEFGDRLLLRGWGRVGILRTAQINGEEHVLAARQLVTYASNDPNDRSMLLRLRLLVINPKTKTVERIEQSAPLKDVRDRPRDVVATEETRSRELRSVDTASGPDTDSPNQTMGLSDSNIADVVFDGNSIITVGTMGVWRSTSTGELWETSFEPMEMIPGEWSGPSCMKYDPDTGQIFYANYDHVDWLGMNAGILHKNGDVWNSEYQQRVLTRSDKDLWSNGLADEPFAQMQMTDVPHKPGEKVFFIPTDWWGGNPEEPFKITFEPVLYKGGKFERAAETRTHETSEQTVRVTDKGVLLVERLVNVGTIGDLGMNISFIPFNTASTIHLPTVRTP